jgi:hypothetical protein
MDPEPDHLVRGTVPRIQVRIRIRPICHGSGTLVSALVGILDVYTRGDSDFLPSQIPDLGSRIPNLGSRISDPRTRIPVLGSRISDTGSNKNENEEVGKILSFLFCIHKFIYCKLFHLLKSIQKILPIGKKFKYV